MSIELQRIGWCDACTEKGKQTKVDPDESQVTVPNATGTLHTLNLCKTDRRALLEPVWALADKYGVKITPSSNGAKRPAVQPTRRDGTEFITDIAPQCPKCDRVLHGGRTHTITHMVSKHGMDRAEASRLLPAVNPCECSECGFIADGVQGLSAHVASTHTRAGAKQ